MSTTIECVNGQKTPAGVPGAPQTPTMDADTKTVVNAAPGLLGVVLKAEEAAKVRAEEAAKEDARVMNEIKAEMGKCVSSFSRGEREYSRGLLCAGRHAGAVVNLKRSRNDSRESAVQAIEGALALYASAPVDVNRMVLCYSAAKLFGEEAEKTTIPYGHYRDAWSKLVERTSTVDKQDAYVLLPGKEAECQALFETMRGKDRKSCVEAVQDLVAAHLKAQRDAKEAAQADADRRREETEKEAKTQRDAADLAKAQQKRADDEAAKAAQEAAQKPEDKEAALASEKANADAVVAAQKVKEDEEKARVAKKAADEAKRDQQRKAQAAEEAAKRQQKHEDKPRPGPATSGPANLIKVAQRGTPKDRGENAVEIVASGDNPDDALREFARLAQGRKEFSGHYLDAVKGFIVMLAKAAQRTEEEACAKAAQNAVKAAPAGRTVS